MSPVMRRFVYSCLTLVICSCLVLALLAILGLILV